MTARASDPTVGVVVHDHVLDLVFDAVVVEYDGRAEASVTLDGVLCASTAPRLAELVERMLALGVSTMRFDLSPLRLCTSDGIELWIALAARLERAGGSLVLTNHRGCVRRVLEAAGLPELERAMAT